MPSPPITYRWLILCFFKKLIMTSKWNPPLDDASIVPKYEKYSKCHNYFNTLHKWYALLLLLLILPSIQCKWYTYQVHNIFIDIINLFLCRYSHNTMIFTVPAINYIFIKMIWHTYIGWIAIRINEKVLWILTSRIYLHNGEYQRLFLLSVG